MRPLSAQVTLQVTSVNVNGAFDSVAACPELVDDPERLLFVSEDHAPVSILSQAVVDNTVCRSRGTALASATFFETTSSLQISGTASVSTLASVLFDAPPGDSFGAADTTADLDISIDFEVSHWMRLSFAGTMTIGTVTAVGMPEHSSASLLQSWQLYNDDGRLIVERSLELGSDDKQVLRQDTHYRTVLAAPGAYTLHLRIVGQSAADIQVAGVTGRACTGTYGLAISGLSACVTDWDDNGVVDTRDFFEFLNAFFLEAADFNEDSVVDSQDLFDFISAFMQGCA